jgi:glycosyltransferase involved in cell wall biosynthesis
MTRVALLPSAYPPALGGVEELTRHLALALVEAGDQVEVWTLHGDDARPESVELRDLIVVRRFPMPLPGRKWSSIRRSTTIGPRTVTALRRAVTAFRPDVLHVQCFGPNGVYATALARLTGLPLVVTLQGETVMDDSDIFESSRVLRMSLRSGLRRAGAVTGCSAFALADAERRFGLAPGRGQVIPNGVDLNETGPGGGGTTDGPAPPDRPYILAVGRVVEKKGFDLLLAAYAGMDESLRSADLVIGGAGAALEDLRALAGTLGVAERVHFVGRLTREQVARFTAEARLFVVPSRLEPFGIVILEGWRAGVAMVATSRGGPPEFVHDGKDGVLVDPFDTSALASTLETLLSDDDRRLAIAAAGRARVESYAWPAIAGRYREVYDAVVGSVTRYLPAPERAGRSEHGQTVA